MPYTISRAWFLPLSERGAFWGLESEEEKKKRRRKREEEKDLMGMGWEPLNYDAPLRALCLQFDFCFRWCE